MANYALLNNVQHGALKVVNGFSREAGDGRAAVMTFPTEFADIQREYPILLSRDADSSDYRAIALLGIQEDENLFLNDGGGGNGWVGHYVPAVVARGPFITGFQQSAGGQVESPEPMIYVDMDSPKLSETEGEPLFLPFGGNSPYLEQIAGVLRTIQQGEAIGGAMYRAFDELGLIEPVTINIDLSNGDKHQISGYCTISEERLANLAGDELLALNRAGYLQGAFLIMASFSNVSRLVNMKNTRLQ